MSFGVAASSKRLEDIPVVELLRTGLPSESIHQDHLRLKVS